jgi:hypothetical protein
MREHFEDGETVRIKEQQETVTVKKWSLSHGPGKHMVRYTYTMVEYPGTFFFHDELEEVSNDR